MFTLLELQNMPIKEIISLFNVITPGHSCDILTNALKYYATSGTILFILNNIYLIIICVLEKYYPNQPLDINTWYFHSLASTVHSNSNILNPKEMEYLSQKAANDKSNFGSIKLLHYLLS